MRWIALLLLSGVLLTAACGDVKELHESIQPHGPQSSQPEATSTPPPEPTDTPVPPTATPVDGKIVTQTLAVKAEPK